VRFTLIVGATAKKTESLRAADGTLGSQWYVGGRAGNTCKHPIPQIMREMWEHSYRKGYELAIAVELE
jgi:hypothetical protein